MEQIDFTNCVWRMWWKTYFYINILSILPNPAELLHNWVLTSFKHQEPAFYTRLFDDPEEGPFEVPPCCTKVGVIIKPVPGSTKLHVFQNINITCVICSFLSIFLFFGEKAAADCSKDDIWPSLQGKYSIQFAPSAALNFVIEKGKPQWKRTYKYSRK